MNDYGIVFDSTFLNVDFSLAPNEEKGIFNDEIIVIIQNPTDKILSMSFQVFPLTTFGIDLVSTINKKTLIYNEFAEYIKNKFTDFNVTCHKILEITEAGINYEEIVLMNQ